jgi:predicted O-methyltransferase YrrM
MEIEQLEQKPGPVATGRPDGHPLKELLYRLRDPELVVDTTLRAISQTWHLISPSKFSQLYRRVHGHTMCSVARLRALHEAVKWVVENRIPGDVVECGCARGGSAALMALSMRQRGERRCMWLFDTFDGLPAPTKDNPDYEIAKLLTGRCFGRLEEVQELFREQNIDEDVQFVKGLFQKTIPQTPIDRIGLLHIDGDWYESVKVCLEELYDKVAPGGIIQLDDYGYWKGARKAVDEFLEKRGIQARLEKIDYSGRTLRKL